MNCTKEITLWCDNVIQYETDGGTCLVWEQVSSSSSKEARKELKKRGWTHHKDEDYCPECSKLSKTR